MIILKTDSDIEDMKKAGKLAWDLLEEVSKHIAPGITTEDINTIVHDMTIRHGAIPAPLNYKGFPKSVCTSVNEVVCHGIPSKAKTLREGDIINVDVTPIVDGYHGDSSRTFFVGTPSPAIKKLVDTTRKSLQLGIEAVHSKARVGDIGAAIQSYAESQGFSIVREFVGHGIGKTFHEEPQIPHYGRSGRGARLQPGMVFTIEPMLNAGKHHCEILDDDWTAVTRDDSWSAQFEHTIAIKQNGEVVILTDPTTWS